MRWTRRTSSWKPWQSACAARANGPMCSLWAAPTRWAPSATCAPAWSWRGRPRRWGSAGTQAGLCLALAHELPELPVIGVTVSRPAATQRPKVEGLIERCAALLGVEVPAHLQVQLWDEYHGPCYGAPNEGTLAALNKLARCEGLLLDPVYTGKAMDGLLDGIALTRFAPGPVLFLHTGGTPALFAYPPATA